MAKQNPFTTAEGKRIELTNNQVKQIRSLYKDVRHEFQDRIRVLSNKTNISSQMRDRYLKDFAKDLSADINYLNKQLEVTITNNALKMAEAVVEDSNKLTEAMGFRGIFTNDYYIPHQAVESIITGQLYDGKWTLSKAIWSDNQKKLNDINEIVAKGMIANKSAYDIAKDLERYVNPQARKDWEWSKVYPGTTKKIDYNAQRLARTMVSHAYQESFVRSTRENPFIDSYRWLASGSDRMCELCAERDGKIFSKDELPLDHPNGMCTFEAVIEKSYDKIASDIKNWVDGTGDPELNNQLDGFANSLGYNVKTMTSQNLEIKNANSGTIKREKDVRFLDHLNNKETRFPCKAMEKVSNYYNLSEEEMKVVLTDTTKRLLDENNVTICVNPDTLSSILDDGFKNQFQTGTSSGVFAPDDRKLAEYATFGISKNSNINVRPVYGSLMPKSFESYEAKSYFLSGDATGVYGNACCVINKDAIINNATLTLDDSLNNVGSIIGTPLNDINIKTIGSNTVYDLTLEKISLDTLKQGKLEDILKGGSYIEVQIFGEESKKANNIEKIIFKRELPDDSILEKLKERNIPWEVIE